MNGTVRALAAVVMAAVMAMPAMTAVAPSGEREHRSNGSTAATLMVSISDTLCLAVLADGTLLAGSAGGGVAEWSPDGGFMALATSVEGLPSAYVYDLAVLEGVAYAATSAGVAKRLSRGLWTSLCDDQFHALCSSDTHLIARDSIGTVFESPDGASWSALVVPGAGMEGVRWWAATAHGDLLALSNGVGIILVNLTTMDDARVILPLEGPSSGINDLALSADRLAVAFNDRPDIYDLGTGTWLDPSVADSAKSLGYNWSRVAIGQTVLAGSRETDAVVARLDPGAGDPPGPTSWMLVATLDMSIVLDLVTRPDGGAYATTYEGTWSMSMDGTHGLLGEGTVSSPPMSYMDGVEIAGGFLWTVSRHGINGLALDQDGQPTEWAVVQDPDLGMARSLRDAAELAGVVYFVVGAEVWSYDLYASSKPSRWAALPFGDGLPDDRVYAVETMGTHLYAGGAFGVARLAPEREPTPWDILVGAPEDVRDLAVTSTGLVAATDTGLWEMNASTGAWARPADTGWLPPGRVSALAVSTGGVYAAVGSDVHWSGATAGSLVCGVAVVGLSSLPGAAFPVWATLSDSTAVAILPDASTFSWGRTAVGIEADDRGLGGGGANAIAVGPDGTAWFATGGGLHRVIRFGTSWSSWTTSDGLSANDIRTLRVEPSSDRVWTGAYGGVDVLTASTGSMESIGTEQGLPSNLVYDIEMHSGDVWVATDAGGAARRALSGGQWTSYNMSTGLVADDVQALAFIGTKAVFGTDSGVSVVDLVTSTISTHTQSSTAGALPSDWVWCELATADRVWAGTQGGLAWYDPASDRWARALADELAGREVRSLMVDSTGQLWVGTTAGVLVLDVASGASHELAGMSTRAALALIQDSQGDVWAGTGGGAVLMDADGRVKATFTTREGLVHDRVTSLAELPEGVMWFGTAGGLSRMERTDWDLLPQWVMSMPEMPDLSVSQADVTVHPGQPSEGEMVTVSVRVLNPSSLRAIGTVVLAASADPAPGEELASAIAYTEPGGEYMVALCWTAVGGDNALWVVVDPEDRVPESDERNNAVAVGISVNRLPVLLSPSYRLVNSSGMYLSEPPLPWSGTFEVDVLYRDLDGQSPSEIQLGRVSPLSEDFAGSHHWNLLPVVPGGDVLTGRLYRGNAYLGRGNTTLYIWASDGLGSNWTSIVIPFNFNVSVSGINTGDRVNDRVRVDFTMVGPWEGDSIVNLTAWRALEDTALGLPGWTEIPSTRQGMSLTLDLSDVPEGPHDIWLVAVDDRGVYSRVIVEDVQVDHPESRFTLGLVSVIVMIGIIVAVVATLIALIRIRTRGEA